MVRYGFLRWAALALGIYGVLGMIITAAMLIVGASTFSHISSLQANLETQRVSLVQSMRTVSATLKDTSGATTNIQQSVDGARSAADRASTLANSSAGTFRDLGSRVAAVSLLGVQPLAGVAPQFDASADQLQQLAISLGATRDSLAQNGSDVQRVGTDLSQLQTQLDAIAASLSQPGVLGLDAQSLLPFEVAFYGICLLVALQSVFSLIGSLALYRLQRAMGVEPLFPHLRTATTTDGVGHDRVRRS
jgi:hypothetical protein